MPAAVQADPDVPQATISIRGIDLTTESGQEKLRVRIASEVRRMCSVEGAVDTYISGLRSDCMKTARNNADAAFARAVADARRDTSRLAAR
jgi:UrcA family protein